MKYALLLLVLLSLACMTTVAPAVTALPASLPSTSTARVLTRSVPTAPVFTPAPGLRTLCGNVNIRDNPSSSGASYGVLRSGDQIKVFEVRGAWLRISAAPARWVVDWTC